MLVKIPVYDVHRDSGDRDAASSPGILVPSPALQLCTRTADLTSVQIFRRVTEHVSTHTTDLSLIKRIPIITEKSRT